MVAVIRKNGDIRVVEDILAFAYSNEKNRIGLQRELPEEALIDCKETTVEITDVLGGYPQYTFLSDADKKKEEKEYAEKVARESDSKPCSDGDASPRFRDPLAELEYYIREWCMKNGYVDDDQEWFIVRIETGYKKKVLVVNILSKENVTAPKKSVFEGSDTSEMFGKAMAFYRGGCR